MPLLLLWGRYCLYRRQAWHKGRKKKLSIFGLRPKHTSIIVTIVTGILISAATLGLMTAVSWDVRTALFGMEELKAELISLNDEVDSRTKELEQSRASLETKNAEYAAVTQKVKETADRLTKIMAELATVTSQRDQAATALSSLQSDYALAQRDLTSYQKSIKTLQATKAELDTKINELTTAKTSLQSDVDRLNELTTSLKNGIQIVREGTVVFRTGEVLSNAVIEGGKSQEDTATALADVIYRTNRMILAKLGLADKNLELLWISRTEYDQAAALIAKANQPVIVRISTVGNTVYGEPVIGRLELFPNHLIYNKGEVVYSETMNAPNEGAQAGDHYELFAKS